MTDPLKLAALVESDTTLIPEERALIAAALRLAECLDRAHRGLVDGRPIRMYGLSGPEGQALLDAYREARGA